MVGSKPEKTYEWFYIHSSLPCPDDNEEEEEESSESLMLGKL
jgi:hypothetical protein